VICKRCKKEFKQNRATQIYCSRDCQKKAHVKRNHKGKVRKNKYCNTASYRNIILSHFSFQCDKCGKMDDLQLHHIIPRYLGGKDILSNITCLCIDCHALVHEYKPL